MICGDTPTYGWVDGWGSCQITKNLINLDLIEIIQFSLKIYDLWKHPTHGWVYGWLGVWVVGCMGGWVYGWVDG